MISGKSFVMISCLCHKVLFARLALSSRLAEKIRLMREVIL